jgi:twitching motility protein PilU
MEHAIAFAETGHLCLGTLHSNSANQAIELPLDIKLNSTRKAPEMSLAS